MTEISELTLLARKLNKKSDQVNRTLTTLNQKLTKLNVGVEIWLDTPLPTEEKRIDDKGVCHREAGYLGYSRRLGEWQLTVREVNTDVQPNGDTVQTAPLRYHSLLKCRRDARLAALVQVPRLLDALKAESERLLKSIDAAERTAQAL